jgi:hypothetical protein
MQIRLDIQRRSRGQSLVEFSLVILIVFVLLAGSVDLGELVFQYTAMHDAAQEGAVYAAIFPNSCSQILQRVRSNLAGINSADVQVSILVNGVDCGHAAPGDACFSKMIDVIVDQPNYDITTPFVGTFLSRQTLHISAAASGVILRPLCP